MALHTGLFPSMATGGTAFTFLEVEKGMCLESIAVSAIRACICAISVKLVGDGSKVERFGSTSGHGAFNATKTKVLKLEKGERITQLFLWGNGEGTRLGWIEMKTSTGRTFSHGMRRKRVKSYKKEVGSGVCLGVRGRQSKEIHQLEFVFVSNNVVTFKLASLSYPLPDKASTIKTTTLQELRRTTHNQSEEEGELLYWVFTGSMQVDPRSTWVQLSPKKGLIEYTNGASGVLAPGIIPKVEPSGSSGSSSTFRWNRTANGGATTSTNISSTNTAWYYAAGAIAQGQSVHKRALIGIGNNPSIPFNAFMQTPTGNLRFAVTGTYTGTSYTNPQIV